MELCLVFRPLAGSLGHFLEFQLLFLFCFVFLKSVPGVGSEEGQRLASFVLCGHRSPASRSSSEILAVHAPAYRLNWRLEPYGVHSDHSTPG